MSKREWTRSSRRRMRSRWKSSSSRIRAPHPMAQNCNPKARVTWTANKARRVSITWPTSGRAVKSSQSATICIRTQTWSKAVRVKATATVSLESSLTWVSMTHQLRTQRSCQQKPGSHSQRTPISCRWRSSSPWVISALLRRSRRMMEGSCRRRIFKSKRNDSVSIWSQ